MSESKQHVIPFKTYALILAALLALTLITYHVALVDLGPWNIVVAIVIACTKAVLVVLFFMHAAYAPRRTRLVILAGVFWLLLLLGLTLADYLTRPPATDSISSNNAPAAYVR
ncbi:MAG TPA: cytochrome C oxidase subunit IV family protein [Methylomirabilota bacterium]|jgi:cytochrome c oxidase subunit 4|nr:cytochrome C oxidase subunit IV family protein [Methylomirabilota bacterium]